MILSAQFVVLYTGVHLDTWYKATEPGFAGDIDAMEIWLIDWYLMHCSDLQFRAHASEYYPYMCEMMMFEMKPELRSILRRYFVRTGSVFGITHGAIDIGQWQVRERESETLASPAVP